MDLSNAHLDSMEKQAQDELSKEAHLDDEHGTVEIISQRQPGPLGYIFRLERWLGVETRGIERVPESIRERKTRLRDYAQMSVIWFSANVTANNVLVGLLGPLVYELGLVDAMLLASFGAMFGAICSAYISTFGPMSGCRTMVCLVSWICVYVHWEVPEPNMVLR